MKGGDISRCPARALLFHVDCCLEQDLSDLGKVVRLVRPMFGWSLRPGTTDAASRMIFHTDYSFLVAVLGTMDPERVRSFLEDQSGVPLSRVLSFREEGDLREFLLNESWVETYYDPDEERVARISIRARLFDGWRTIHR